MMRVTLSLVLAVLLGSCRPALAPAPKAHIVPGSTMAAFAQAHGVRVVAAPNLWSGNPVELRDWVVPMRVTIENGSDQPLRIRYDAFDLVGPEGQRFSALPPYRLDGSVIKPIFLPQSFYGGFYVAPPYRGLYPDVGAWRHPWDYDEKSYSARYDLWIAPLPTADMVEKAIPEGVLGPRGYLSGYLYFEMPDNELSRVSFEAILINAESGETYGKIRIPFVIS